MLHRLAADPGIVAVMERNQWSVGRLSEMPPEGVGSVGTYRGRLGGVSPPLGRREVCMGEFI